MDSLRLKGPLLLRQRLLRQRLLRRALLLPRSSKRLIMIGLDLALLPLALWAAFALRLGQVVPDMDRLWWMFPAVVAISLPIFVRLGLYRAVIRFMGPQVVSAVFQGVTLATLVLGLVTLLAGHNLGLPRSVLILFWMIALLCIGGSRFFIRGLLQGAQLGRQPPQPLIIYGAGLAGARLATVLQGSPEYEPVAFVDDDPGLQGGMVRGIRVYPPLRLQELVQATGAAQVLLAVPTASPMQRKTILTRLAGLPVRVRTIPTLSDLVLGSARLDEIREVEINDLLGRNQVAPDAELLRARVEGKNVLVTGAGGSIGGELCRQLLRLAPKRLVLIEQSEYALYCIERDLLSLKEQLQLQVEVAPLLGDAVNGQRLERIMRDFGIATVYHAAAYKHVPIVEHNIAEGVRNNVFGAWRAAEAARAAGVETFVLISTDKAVRPTNVMGASKRMAELVLQGLAQQQGSTTFCMVRFGNVLGSSGSVVPLFREQIGKGGPVTVTHPEVTRYFMTIPEAAALVIQASALASGGDVFVLDMGEPVKIADLARKMVQLSGHTIRDENNPDGDIEIRYTGLRPGEKLYEELLIGDKVTGTRHPMILRAEEERLPWERVKQVLAQLERGIVASDCASVRRILAEAVNGYAVRDEMHDLTWKQAHVVSFKNVTRLRN